MDVKRLAKAVLDAQEIREESYDINAADKSDLSVNSEHFYAKTYYEASVEAAYNVKFNRTLTTLIYILISQSWKKSRLWAKSVLKTEDEK